jgi:hypothetical protein
MVYRRHKSPSSRDYTNFDDIFKDMGFGGFRDIFEAIFERREIDDAKIIKMLDPENKAKFQKELADKTEDGEKGVIENEQFRGVSGHDLSADKIEQNGLPSSPSHAQSSKPKPPSTPKGPVFTSVSQITSYLKVGGIQSEIEALEPEWGSFGLKELGANCYDFLRVRYPNAPKESRKVAFHVKLDSGILSINARNSNNGYASWNSIVDNENSLQNSQWPEPVILRFNKKEYKIFLIVEEELDGTPNPYPKIEGPFPYEDAFNYTEVEIALPVKHLYTNPTQQELLLEGLHQSYKVHTMAPRNIEFSFVNEGVSGGDKQ